MLAELVPGFCACRFVLIPGEVHDRRHNRSGHYLAVADGVDAYFVEYLDLVVVEHGDFPLVCLFVRAVVSAQFQERPVLVRHSHHRDFVECFAKVAFEVEVGWLGSRLVEERLGGFPERGVFPYILLYLVIGVDIGIDEQQQAAFLFLFLVRGESAGFDILPVIGRDQGITEKGIQSVSVSFQCVDAPFVDLLL